MSSLGGVINNQTECDEEAGAQQREEAQQGPLGQHLAAQARAGVPGTLLRNHPLHREAVVLDDVPVVGQRGLDDDLIMHLAIEAEARVPHVAQRVSEVTLQVDTIQDGGWDTRRKRRSGGGSTESINRSCPSTVTGKLYLVHSH